jgi:hypothetical protein
MSDRTPAEHAAAVRLREVVSRYQSKRVIGGTDFHTEDVALVLTQAERATELERELAEEREEHSATRESVRGEHEIRELQRERIEQLERDRDEARGAAKRHYERATELEDALRRAKMRAIDAYNECDTAPQDHFLRDIENIARAALGEAAP